MSSIHCDIAIIGAGPGGLTLAAVASQLGLNVVLIEHNKMGGDCLNTGCIPSKSLIAAAKSAHNFLMANQFGIESLEPKINFSKVMEQVTKIINTIGQHDSIARFTKLGTQVIQGHARFIDINTLIVNDTRIQAGYFVIATGSSPAIPPINGINAVPFLTNENIFELKTKPEHLIVIGGGPIGCELAQAFLFLGVRVTLLEALQILPRDEPDLVMILRQQLISDGLTLYENINVQEVKKLDNIIEVTIEKNNEKIIINASHLLVATGRRANVENLDLEKAGIDFSPKGIKTDNRLRTTNKKIYAIGDVTGPYQFTHIANYHAGVVIKNIIFKLRSTVNYRSIPWVTYTTPELAHTGMTETEALKKYSKLKIFSCNLVENDRAQTEHETTGKIKIIVDAKARVLGVSILAPHAGDLILPWIMLINENKTLRSITDTIIPYPTLSEIHKLVASEFYKPKLFSKSIRRLVKFLKLF